MTKALIWYAKADSSLPVNGIYYGQSTYYRINAAHLQQLYYASFDLAEIYYHSIDNNADYAKALFWYEKSLVNAEQVADDFPLADIYLRLGWMYLKGYGTEANFSQSYDYYVNALELLQIKFGNNIDEYLKNLPPEQEKTITIMANIHENQFSVESINKLAEIGIDSSHALYMTAFDKFKKNNGKLFNYLTNDENQRKDAPYYWFKKAIENNSAEANYVLATMTESPWIFDLSYSMYGMDKVFNYYKKADELGSLKAKFALASYYEMYENDCQHAAEVYHGLLSQSEDEIKALTEFNLGRLYYHGYGVTQNSKQAWILLNSAAMARHPSAQKFTFSISANDPDVEWLKQAFEQAKQDPSYSSPVLIIK